MPKLIECVPNFSEGRNLEIIEALAEAIKSTRGVKLLDYSADPDHHRSVFTFIGSPDAVGEAAFRSAAKAVESIDLSTHQGIHPRIGAVDVIPFVPLRDVSMSGCVEIARRTAKKIETELKVPVYLYAEAAACQEHLNLASIRKLKITRCHPTAGAVAVGARDFLIAFNVNLDSADLKTAREIAANLRKLPAVKALGLFLKSKGLVQVSMNLTDFRKTGLQEAFARVAAEAEKLNLKIKNSEIIGLIPRAAAFPDMESYLKCDQIKIIENSF